MCCFSREIESVTNTRIFARWIPAAQGQAYRQCIVYQMEFRAAEDLSMILPIPVPPASAEKAVAFVDLSKEPEFFKKLDRCFPAEPLKAEASRMSFGAKANSDRLEVVKVGSFDASFVPTVADFSRLDARFRLPTEVWGKLPQYNTWGFAVFKLRKEAATVHPMAFTFPRRDPEKGLFLPTVHIHDGQVHKKAEFDHTLYVQRGAQYSGPKGWTESVSLPSAVFSGDVKGIVDRAAHAYRRRMVGEFSNEDVWV